ncbi:MAG: DUF2461 family protein [Candidatus Thorarchaeota archaeon]|nr:DUF2461 family protein [Candidatus Thorarchaeota archaeon]
MNDIPPFVWFPRQALKFLEDLHENNNRAWFEDHSMK